MENASKALIIAGAILLSILIITLGLSVYQNAKDTVTNANLSEQEIQAFNSKFVNYEGTKVSGSNVNALIQLVIASNEAEKQKGTNHYICANYQGNGNTNKFRHGPNSDKWNPVNTGRTYTVVLSDVDTGEDPVKPADGLISLIDITMNN